MDLTTPIPRSHDQKRRILQAQHDLLRDLVARLREVAGRVGAEKAPSAALAEKVLRLRDALEVHLREEESFLIPILERLDAWGPERLRILKEEHVHQRALIAALCRNLPERPPEELAVRALGFADDLLADMALEERELLDPSVLTDEMIRVDQDD